MRRYIFILSLVVVIASLFLWTHLQRRGASENSESGLETHVHYDSRNDKVYDKAEENKKNSALTHTAGKLPQSLPETDEVIQPAETRGSPYSDAEKETYFSASRQDFGPNLVEVEGTATLSLRGYEEKFKVQFLVPSKSYIGAGTPGGVPIPFFMASIKNPAANGLGHASLDEISTDSDSFLIHSFGPLFLSLLSNKAEANGIVTQENELKQITDLLFTVELKEKRNSAVVQARVSFDGAPTNIGKLDYLIK